MPNAPVVLTTVEDPEPSTRKFRHNPPCAFAPIISTCIVHRHTNTKSDPSQAHVPMSLLLVQHRSYPAPASLLPKKPVRPSSTPVAASATYSHSPLTRTQLCRPISQITTPHIRRHNTTIPAPYAATLMWRPTARIT